MSNPAVSVIIPAYNAQEYLRECLESVLAQSFPDFEAIVVNDGSADNTRAIAEEFAAPDSRIKVLSTGNQGLSCARNNGVDVAVGEWVTFLDSDDRLYTWSLESLFNGASASGCDIVKGRWSRLPDPVIEMPFLNDNVSVLSSVTAIESILYQTFSQPSACATLYRRRLLDNVRFTPGIWYEDLDFFYHVFLQTGSVAFIDQLVYFYRDNPASFLNRFSPGRLDVLKVTEAIENFMRNNRPDLLPAARDRRLSANFNLFALLMLETGQEDYIAEKNQCWHIIRSYRSECLFNPKTRLKNKLGSLLSYLGRRPLLYVARFIYR